MIENPKRMLKVVAMLAAAFPSWKLEDEGILLWVRELGTLDPSVVEEVVLAIIRSDREWPPPLGLIYTRASELVAKRRRERQEAELRHLAAGIVNVAPRLANGRLDLNWMIEELERQRPDLVIPERADGQAYSVHKVREVSRKRSEAEAAIIKASQDREHQLQLCPRPSSLAAMVSGVRFKLPAVLSNGARA